jgi:hypothetical protein
MDELTLDNKIYLSSRQAAKVTGYAKDYVGQLCREGRVAARLVGRNWYVLESSILEHRFGAEKTEESPVAASAAVASPWEAPVYTSEPVHMVPEMVAKPAPEPIPEPLPTPIAVSAPHEVLADMQSAWQEWFESQKEEEKSLPDASEMLLADHSEEEITLREHESPLEMPSKAPVKPTFNVSTVPQAQAVAEELPLPVHIERIRNEEVSTRSFISIDRQHVRPSARESYARPAASVYGSSTRKNPQSFIPVSRAKRSAGFALRAVFLSLAGLAIAVTVIGSGFADTALLHNGVAGYVADFFSGTRNIQVN